MWGIYYEGADAWLTRRSDHYDWATWEKTNLKWKTKPEAEIGYKKIYQNRNNSLVKLKEVKTPREPETYIPVKRQIHIKK